MKALTAEISVLTPKVDEARATYLKAFKDGENKDFVAALKSVFDDLKAQLDGLLAVRSRELSARAASSPPTQGKSQLPARAFVYAPSSHVHLSLFVRSSRAPCVPPSALCTFKSALCVGSSCVRADSASRLGERD